MYDMKALYEAESVENAVALRLEHPEAQIIAGGSDVLVQMREGKRAGKELISIYGLDELRGVSIDEEENSASARSRAFPTSRVTPSSRSTSMFSARRSTWSAARRSETSAPSAATPATA